MFYQFGNRNNLKSARFKLGQKPLYGVYGLIVALVHKHDSAVRKVLGNGVIHVVFGGRSIPVVCVKIGRPVDKSRPIAR